ncbi:MAG: hypothetical protein Q4E88_06325 [Coriobacteriia bacterium]|nr:hypothetical protein [Coriobacteriia bacterium]
MRTFQQLTEDFIDKTTNIFRTEIDNKFLSRVFSISKVVSILIPIAYCALMGLGAMNEQMQFSEYLATNPMYVLLFLASMLCIFIAYELKTIELHLVDGEHKQAVTNIVLMLVSQLILINPLYFFIFGLILFKSRRIYSFKIKENIDLTLIPCYSKLPVLIILLNIFIMVQTLP